MRDDFINWPYYLYTHRGWISRLVENVSYIGDGYYEHRVSLDINTKELESYLAKNGYDPDETPYLLIPLNDLNVSLLPEFDAKDENGKPLSLLSLEERISHEIAILDGYVRDNFKSPLLKGIKRHLEYKFLYTVYEDLSPDKEVFNFEIDWDETSRDSRLTVEDKEAAQKQWESLFVDYGFQWLIFRFIRYWVPIVVVEHSFKGDDELNPQIPRIIKYRYIEPWIQPATTYKACKENVNAEAGEIMAVFLLQKIGWYQFFGMEQDHVMTNVASSEREYFKLIAPEGLELTNLRYTPKNKPDKRIKFYDEVFVSEDDQEKASNYSVEVSARLTPERSVIRTRRWWFEGDCENSSNNWKPPRIPRHSMDDHSYSVTVKYLPACRGLWIRYFIFALLVAIFLSIGQISLVNYEFFANILKPENSSTVLIQASAILLPLFSGVVTARGAVGYFRRYLLRWPTIMTYSLGILVMLSGIAWIAYTTLSEFVKTATNSLTDVFFAFWWITFIVWLLFVVSVIIIWTISTNTRRRWYKQPGAMSRFEVKPGRVIERI